ncbi:MAG: DUF3160 domain-containing protein [Chloroflexi bacterium]|nr:DUF3160 domain-containing protein [Chloroflexota bacterium]
MPPVAVVVDENAKLLRPESNFVEGAAFDPQAAVYYDLINNAMPLNEEELALLAQNGFVVTDRLNWTRFVEAYAWIYKNDLPVIVTSDSILHAVHQSYANILQQLEKEVLHPELVKLLKATRAQVQLEASQNTDSVLSVLYQDVEDYLAVAIVLAEGEALRIDGEPYTSNYANSSIEWTKPELDVSLLEANYSPRVQELVRLAWEADTATDLSQSDSFGLTLFNHSRPMDFTLFQPRAHYNNTLLLGNYFRAVSWLAHVDFRWVDFDPVTSEPRLNLEAVAASKILQEALDTAHQRQRWVEITDVFAALIGQADNTTLFDLDQLNEDMGWVMVQDVLDSDRDQLLQQLLNNDYGQQRITGQIIGRYIENDSEAVVPRPVSFMLMGQLFALDSWVMGSVVYDRVLVNGQPVERPLPTGFDVMVALGNDHALSHLEPELAQYPYEPTLATIRQNVDALGNDYWQATIYNQWLQMIRSLNAPTTGANYPTAMQTVAWADKNLHTQLASWAQLRHDNILYVKQSYTSMQVLCEFPSVYVEPQPALYLALYDFAQKGYAMVENIDGYYVKDKLALRTFFQNVSESAQLLVLISEKELAQVPLSETEQLFLKSLVIKQDYSPGCGGDISFEEMWDGWYMHLIYGTDESPALIADVHTNPTNDPTSALYPPRVLHVGTGSATALLMIVETEAGPTLHVGPAFAYYEFAEEGFPPVRLNDQLWRERLIDENNYPTAPAWVNSFRLPVAKPATPFSLPTH